MRNWGQRLTRLGMIRDCHKAVALLTLLPGPGHLRGQLGTGWDLCTRRDLHPLSSPPKCNLLQQGAPRGQTPPPGNEAGLDLSCPPSLQALTAWEDAEITTGKRIWDKQAKMLAISCTASTDPWHFSGSCHMLQMPAPTPATWGEVRALGSHHKCLEWMLNIFKNLGNTTPAVILNLASQSLVPAPCALSSLWCCGFHQVLSNFTLRFVQGTWILARLEK